MDVEKFIRNNPLLRLAVPLIAGIAVADACSIALDVWLFLLPMALLFMLAGLLCERLTLLFGVGALSVMFLAGAIVQCLDREDALLRWSEAKGEYSAVFLETPRMGDRTVKALAMLTRHDADTLKARCTGPVYLYFANCVEAEDLKIGERVSFSGKVKNPTNAGNPAEFDYERYLYIKGITGTVYLPVGKWSRDGAAPLTLRMRAMALRERVVQLYAGLNFSEDVRAVLSALTIGDKSELTREIKETYSSVGASHILALSGLHLGILYMVLTLLLPMWRGNAFYPFVREFLVLSVVWLFAFVAGLSPSLLRAALLFTLFSVGRCFRRDASSVNSLAFAAIVMLLVSPRSLFDVGFQLSFTAVLSIILLHSPFRRLLGADNHGSIYRYVVDTLVLSFVAQLGTLPLVWLYFGKFPIYFLLTNMFVVPAAFVIMSLAMVLWVVSPFGLAAAVVAQLLGWVVGTMNILLLYIENLPFSSVELPYVDTIGAWGVAGCLALFVCCFYARRRLLVCSVTLAVVVSTGLWIYDLYSERHSNYMLFYNSRQYSALHLVVSRDVSYLLSTTEERFAEQDYVTAPYLRRHSFAEPRWVCGDYTDDNLSCTSGIVEFCGRKAKMLADRSWQEDSVCTPVDLLYLCKGFLGRMENVLEKYPTKMVVMDAGLHAMSRMRVAKECGNLGVGFVDLSASGAQFFYCYDDNFVPHCAVPR